MKLLFLLIISFNFSVFANSNESAFDGVTDNTDVTDEEKLKAENYIHQGKATKKAQEMCEDENGGYSDLCNEDTKAFKEDSSMRKLEALVPELTQAYAMFNTMASAGGGGGLTAKVQKDGEQVWTKDGKDVPEGTEGATEKTESKPDYCGYIGMVGEAVNTGYMAIKNDKTQQSYEQTKPEAKQVASFYAIADSHKNMRKAATVQFGTWTATAACYVAYATQAAYSGDWKVYAKMAAAGLIATYYKKKADAHKERERLLKELAKSMPQAGECNPYTNRSCFCSEDTSYTYDPVNFKNYCVPKELANRDGDLSNSTVCADQNGKVDASCKCAETNTCIDKKLKVAGINLGLEPTRLKDPLAALKPVSKGMITSDLNTAAAKNLALANKTLKNYKPTDLPKLSNRQKKIAKDYIKNGVPKAAAIMMAKASKGGSASAPKSALAGIGGNGIKNYGGLNKKKIAAMQGPRKKSGGSVASKRSRSTRSNPFAQRGKSRKSGPAIEIEDYATKAQREAEIVKDSDRGIFEIISYRYKMNAWQQWKENLKPTN